MKLSTQNVTQNPVVMMHTLLIQKLLFDAFETKTLGTCLKVADSLSVVP